jgi:glutamine amidotransferase-like uncharacterized protein
MKTLKTAGKILGAFVLTWVAIATSAHAGLADSIDESSVEARPLALVYKGKGACGPCAKAAANAANSAGLNVLFVTDKLTDYTVFDRAKVWIQPGGTSSNVIQAMSPEYLSHLRSFISSGGGYVGFCAGAFFSTNENGNMGLPALGIVRGKSLPIFRDFSPEDHAYLMNMTWAGSKRVVYFNGGAYFDLTGVNDSNIQILATYDDYQNKIAAFTTRYGAGKVAVSGAHPEEFNWVKLAHGKIDPDGSDVDLAVKMIQSVIN